MSSLRFTPIDFAAPVSSAVVNSPISELDSAIDDILAGLIPFRRLNHEAFPRTISGDTIAAGRSYISLTPQSGTLDELKTITGGNQGDVLRLQLAGAYTITLKHGT